MISELFAQFIKEKRCICNPSERTIRSYEKGVFNRWLKLVGKMPTKQNLMRFVVGMREQGLSATTCNITIRSFNSFLNWCHVNRQIGEPLKLQQLKSEKRIMRTFTEASMRKILSLRPNKNRCQIRLYGCGGRNFSRFLGFVLAQDSG